MPITLLTVMLLRHLPSYCSAELNCYLFPNSYYEGTVSHISILIINFLQYYGEFCGEG